MSVSHPVIAIVDDEESVRKALVRLLRSAEMEAHVFASRAEFLSALAEFSPDCVVLDLHMPQVSGFEVIAAVQKRLPVVAITGNGSLEAEARALDGGASAYLLKPVDDCALVKAITAAMAHLTSDRS